MSNTNRGKESHAPSDKPRRTKNFKERMQENNQNNNSSNFSAKPRSKNTNGKKSYSGPSKGNHKAANGTSNSNKNKSYNRNNNNRTRKTESSGGPTWAKNRTDNAKHKTGRDNHSPSGKTEPVMSPQLQFPSFRPGAIRGTNIRRAQDHLKENTKNLSSDTLKVIPLGGLMEIGKNMTVFEYGNDMIIVDCGVLFPEESQPGIDAVIPDFNYVLDNVDKLRAIFITHGHEDHIGSLPYLMPKIKKNVPIYAGKLAAELIKTKFEDRGIRQYSRQVYAVEPGQSRRAGVFEIEFINVNHSIADAFCLAIKSPAGIAVASGDFKVDYTPVNGESIDLARLAQLGQEGVLLYLGESTNVNRPGFTMSEKTVGQTFAQQFALAEGRIFVATFSSNVSRVQQIISAAEEVGRKVALVGRSMLNVFNAANNLGYIHMKANTLIELQEVNNFRPDEICIISTGSQGEPMSALTRMAYAEHRSIEIQDGDTVIISATPIPGNEKPIFRVIDELYKRGAKVVYSDIAAIHVSGHANREEHKLMHHLLKPQYFIPIHGEYRMLYNHGALAHELGMDWGNIFILNNGDIFECNPNHARIGGYTSAEAVLIDGTQVTSQDSLALQQRKDLSSDGVVSVSIVLDKNSNLVSKPSILSYGAILDTDRDFSDINDQIASFVESFVKKNRQNSNKLVSSLRSRHFRNDLQNYFYGKTGRRPVTLVSVTEI